MKKASPKKNVPKVALAETEKDSPDFYFAGIGASAGGLEAFEKFFRNLPKDPGMSSVLVTHLDPTHSSILPELLQKIHGYGGLSNQGWNEGNAQQGLCLSTPTKWPCSGKLSSLSNPRREVSYMIWVTDNGCGIPEHIREKVFDPLFTTCRKS